MNIYSVAPATTQANETTTEKKPNAIFVPGSRCSHWLTRDGSGTKCNTKRLPKGELQYRDRVVCNACNNNDSKRWAR